MRVEPGKLNDLLEVLEAALPVDWCRDVESESRSPNLTGRLFAYFRCDETAERRAAMLALYTKGRNMIFVSNIVPVLNVAELSHAEYNAVLMDFHDRVLRKLTTKFPVAVIAAEEK